MKLHYNLTIETLLGGVFCYTESVTCTDHFPFMLVN